MLLRALLCLWILVINRHSSSGAGRRFATLDALLQLLLLLFLVIINYNIDLTTTATTTDNSYVYFLFYEKTVVSNVKLFPMLFKANSGQLKVC